MERQRRELRSGRIYSLPSGYYPSLAALQAVHKQTFAAENKFSVVGICFTSFRDIFIFLRFFLFSSIWQFLDFSGLPSVLRTVQSISSESR